MSHDLRLPHNPKEGLLYGSIICGITAFLMSSFNIYLEFRAVDSHYVTTVLKVFPLFFVIAMLLENFVVRKAVMPLLTKFSHANDSFNAQVLFNVFFTVIGMSIIMTVIGDVVGHGFAIQTGLLNRFITAWPRNFTIVLFIELLIAQPTARQMMRRLHHH